MNLPEKIPPMLAVSVDPFDDPDFLYEIKWDGYRCLIFAEEGRFILQSRNFKVLNDVFPELGALKEQLAAVEPAVVDGEIVALKDGKPSFLWLQKRQGTFGREASRVMREKIPVLFVAFDLLYEKGENITAQPLWRRKEKLAGLKSSEFLVVSTHIRKNGIRYFHAIKEMGLEGMIGKYGSSPYLPGKRSNYWRKCKILQKKPFAVCGYVYNPASRGTLSSLVLGALFDGKLTYYGNVGTGMTQTFLAELRNYLDETRTDLPPFPDPPGLKNVRWAKPTLVAQIQYLELTENSQLRHPLFLTLLPGMKPEECMME
ncbi:MAG: non-homologous end-joining DNA ligase [Bacillota bacterium]